MLKFSRWRKIAVALTVLALAFGVSGPFWESLNTGNFLGVLRTRAAVSLRQTTNSVTGGNGGTSLSATFASAPLSGSLLVAILGAQGNTTINTPTGWSVAINESGSPSQAIFYKIAGASEPSQVTVTVNTSMHLGLHIYEYRGIETNLPFESASSTTGTGTSVNSGAVTNFQPDALILTGITTQAANTSFSGWTSSFTEQNDFAIGTGTSGNRATFAGADRIVSAAGSYSTAASTTVSGAWRGQIAVFRADIQFEQSSFRWFANQDSTSVGSPLAAQNVGATVQIPGTPVRLRMLAHVSSSQLVASARQFKLQYVAQGTGTCASPSGGSPATYTDVATGTGVFRYYDNPTPADGEALAATSTDPTHAGHTVVNQTYEEQNNFTNSQGAILAGQDGKWDFSLIDSSAQAGETYCFRIVEASSSNPFDLYSNYPSLVVGNLSPTITNVTLNGGSDIVLTEGTTTVIQATATVTDPNGFTDISSVTGRIFRTSQGIACAANDNNCYPVSNCPLSGCSGNSCTATCSANIWYHAEPTDLGTPWESDSWSAWMRVEDFAGATSTATSTAVDLLTLLGLSVSPLIDYGSLSVGSSTAVDRQVNVTSTGNASLDVIIYGQNMVSGPRTISINQQQYATSAVAYGAGAVATSTPGDRVELNIPKTAATSSPATSTLFWGISIPSSTWSGNYTGANTFIGAVNTLPWP